MIMRLSVSVSSKLLCLILTLLLFISAGYSWYSLNRLSGEFTQHQEKSLYQEKQQFSLHVGQLKSQLMAWFESFSDINQMQNKGDFEQFSASLAKQVNGLQMHFNINDVWFINDQDVLFKTSEVNSLVKENTAQVLLSQKPMEQIYCEQVCLQLISIPLLNYKGEVGVITVTASLLDILYSLKNVLKRDVAILKIAKNNSGNEIKVLSTSDTSLTEHLLALSKEKDSFISLAKEGQLLELKSNSFLLNFLTLSESDDNLFVLALIENVTELKQKNSRYRDQFLLSIFVVFISVAILIYFIITPFTSRLLMLSQALPKLAKKEFIEFRSLKLSRNSVFKDEFDTLAEATDTLSLELEKLNLDVEQKTKELENIAMYDLLTGLPNRNMLNFELKKQLSKLTYGEDRVALLFLDLDDFKKVNDSHGHNEGDRLLIEAASRILASVRNVDLVCRFGGDEFVVILNRVITSYEVKQIADKILEQFREPIKIDSSIFYVSTSIGIVITDDVEIKADTLISYADIAMYEAKNAGGGQYHVYHKDMYQRVAHRVYMENEVRQALLKGQFSLSLQPQIMAKSKKLYGFEALLRWQHPERGMISPDDFIPILENSEHMIDLGYWVIRRCFEIMRTFVASGLNDTRIAINLSAAQFADPALKGYLQSLLSEFNLSPKYFELELTEQTLVKDINLTIDVMNELKALGFSFAIDDFGTGYSSLSYLKRMPVDVIKIDKSFVFGMLENKADNQIIMSTIAMVQNLELIVVAEGVESRAQLRALTEQGCDIIQGYFFSKPIPERDLFSFVDKHIENGYWKG